MAVPGSAIAKHWWWQQCRGGLWRRRRTMVDRHYC